MADLTLLIYDLLLKYNFIVGWVSVRRWGTPGKVMSLEGAGEGDAGWTAGVTPPDLVYLAVMNLIQLRVVDSRVEATDTVTIVLEPVDGGVLEYRAGQFLTFLFVLNGRELRRSYSFSSTPGIDRLPSVTVKRVVNGEVSRYLIDHLKVGDIVTCLPPSGKFLLEEGERTQVFVAAGSGMTPVYSLIREALYHRPAGKVVLITQNRDSRSVLFRSSLEELVRLFPSRLRWLSLLSAPGKAGTSLEGGHAGVARLNNALLVELLDSMKIWSSDSRAFFYLCGPPGFMRMAVFTLRLLGVPDQEIKRENFVVEYVPPPPVLRDTSPREVVLHAEGKVMRFKTHWPSTILQSALDNGIALPYSCKGGRCGTCAARCISGKVRMSINDVLMERDLAEGLVLTCVGYAETDVELVLE